jgi:hypothetical protein
MCLTGGGQALVLGGDFDLGNQRFLQMGQRDLKTLKSPGGQIGGHRH